MINGNKIAEIKVKVTSRNKIGEVQSLWEKIQSVKGWIDLASGEARYTSYNAKVQESTHIFICDYVKLDERIKVDNSRFYIDGNIYDVVLIDNPMEMNKHLEIFLKYVGVQ